MSRRSIQFACLLTLMVAGVSSATAGGLLTAVSGVVRDSSGTPQMGAMVELIEPNSTIIARAYTNVHGAFVFSHIVPGTYELKATSTAYLPTLRENLRVSEAGKTAVTLTLNTLFEAAQWLPAKPRPAGESLDDWKWTLRSSENRPLLRFVDGAPVIVTNGEDRQSAPQTERRAALSGGRRQFGEGGQRVSFGVEHRLEGASGDDGHVILQADVAPQNAGRSSYLAAYEQQLAPGRQLRTVVALRSDAGLRDGAGELAPRTIAPKTILTRTAESIALGPDLSAELGTQLAVLAGSGGRPESFPFANVAWTAGDTKVGYSVSTSRQVQHAQAMADSDTLSPAYSETAHALRFERGLHQELRCEHDAASLRAFLAIFQDALDHPIVNGGGVPTADMLASGDLIFDPDTQTIRMAGPSYAGTGFTAGVSRRLGNTTFASVTYAEGVALTAQSANLDQPASTAAMHALRALEKRRAQAVSAALNGTISGSGTVWRTAYRWQPSASVTAVDPFDNDVQDAYLSLLLRQPLHRGRMPNGLEAVIDIRNLLAQGYRPFVSRDGSTLYFAQAERSLQGGLWFTF